MCRSTLKRYLLNAKRLHGLAALICVVECTVPLIHGGSHTMDSKLRPQRQRKARDQGKKNKNTGPKSKKANLATPRLAESRSVSVPVAEGKVSRVNAPKIQAMKDGDCQISHREYLGDLAGSVAFTANTYSINPGLPATFPWLSAIAQRYESYRFRSLKFEFETQAATTTTGTVALAVDYDANDAAPDTKAQVLTYRDTVRSPPWKSCCFTAAREDLGKRSSYYVRNGSLGTSQDITLYDVGSLYACTQAQAGTTAVGELYVEYDIHLMTPQAGPLGVGESVYASFTGTSNAAPAATKAGNLPATVSSSGTTTSVSTFTFTQPWRGLCSIAMVGTTLNGIAASGTASTNSESIDIKDAGSTNEIGLYSVNVTAPGQTVIYTLTNASISSCIFHFMNGIPAAGP